MDHRIDYRVDRRSLAGAVVSRVNDWMISAGGWLVALFVAFVSGVVQWRKGNVDETSLVLGKWKELVEAHQSQITALNTQLATQAIEIKDLRTRLIAAERHIIRLEEENAGLKRQFLQNSKSTVVELTKRDLRGLGRDERIDDLSARLDQAGGNGTQSED